MHSSSNSPDSYARFISVVTKEWNLPPEFEATADYYFLRHWTAQEIHDNMVELGIVQNELEFLPRFKRDSAVKFRKALDSDDTETKFWLSFRAVRFPLGSTTCLHNYVLIQQDTSTKKGN